MRVMGIDGYRGGWVGCAIDAQNFANARIVLAEDLTSMITENQIDFALIDMPIGLSSGPEERGVEAATRAFVKGKASSVFNMPARQAIDAEDYPSVNDINRRIIGKAISKQSYHLLPKIRQAEATAGELGQDRLREGHPEVSFAIANNDQAVIASKKSARGAFERISILSRLGFAFDHVFEAMPAKHAVLIDDVLDAMILSWSAVRAANKQHRAFPPNPRRDALGYEMVVWA